MPRLEYDLGLSGPERRPEQTQVPSTASTALPTAARACLCARTLGGGGGGQGRGLEGSSAQLPSALGSAASQWLVGSLEVYPSPPCPRPSSLKGPSALPPDLGWPWSGHPSFYETHLVLIPPPPPAVCHAGTEWVG